MIKFMKKSTDSLGLIKLSYLVLLMIYLVSVADFSDIFSTNQDIFLNLLAFSDRNNLHYIVIFIIVLWNILYLKQMKNKSKKKQSIIQKIPLFLLSKNINIKICRLYNYTVLFVFLLISTLSAVFLSFSIIMLYLATNHSGNLYQNNTFLFGFYIVIFVVSLLLSIACNKYFSNISSNIINCTIFTHKRLIVRNKIKVNSKKEVNEKNDLSGNMLKNNYKLSLSKEIYNILMMLNIAAFISILILSVNFSNNQNQIYNYKKDKQNYLDSVYEELVNSSNYKIKQYNTNLQTYYQNLEQYNIDTSGFNVKNKEYFKYQKVLDDWTNSLSDTKKLQYNNIKDELASLYYIDYFSKKLKKELKNMGAPLWDKEIPQRPIEPIKPKRPLFFVQINDYKSYDYIYNTNKDFWNLNLERDVSINVLPVWIISFLGLIVLWYTSLFLFFICKIIINTIKDARQKTFTIILNNIYFYLLPFKSKGTKRLVFSICSLISIAWSYMSYFFLINRTYTDEYGLTRKVYSDFAFSHYLYIFSSFIYVPLIYVVIIWIYHGYKDSEQKNK